jgi:hypothetical protein
MLNDSLLIKYQYHQDNGIDMHVLGQSLVGFDAVLKDLLEIAGLKDKIEVKVSHVEHGSVEVYNAFIFLADMPFENITHFLDFLKIAAPHLAADANTFFSNTGNVHRSVNDYFAKNEFDSAVVSGLVVAFIIAATDWAGKLYKHNGKVKDLGVITPAQASKLKRMIENGRYKRALAPIMSGDVSSVKLSSIGLMNETTIELSQSSIDNYLPEEAKILPDLKNGHRVKLVGELVTLQSARSDELKIRIHGVRRKDSLLRCILADSSTIENYTKLFKKIVVIDAEVYRKTLYRKPELIVYEMHERQQDIQLT